MLLTSLEVAQVEAGLDQSLYTEPKGRTGKMPVAPVAAAQAGPQVVSQVLADAMKQRRVPAAIAAVEVLSHLGDASILRTVPGGTSPLAEAMVFSDRRVRLAAALAAVKLADGESFWGAGRVGSTLAWFLGTGGTSAVLIGHPRLEDAQSLAGLVNGVGYEGRTAISGRAAAQEAFANPDIEMALISDSIDGLPVMETVQWLRRDFRTARLPIGVMARVERVTRWQENLNDDPYTRVFPGLHSAETTEREVKNLQALAGRDLVPRDERIAQGLAAVAALMEVAKENRRFKEFDLLALEPAVIRGLYNPALTARVAELLAHFGTPKAQTALVDFASQSERPLGDRRAAAAAFAQAVKARGLLLTQVQIAMQYERYNASQKQDPATQEVLGAILDAIEAPTLAEK
jgi:hypothetical protein